MPDAAELDKIHSWSEIPLSLLNFGPTPKKITYNWIRDILVKRYLGRSRMQLYESEPGIRYEFTRELVITESLSEYGTVGAVLFAVNGSPPKGYALYINDSHLLSFYDRLGKRFLIMDGAFLMNNEGECVYDRL